MIDVEILRETFAQLFEVKLKRYIRDNDTDKLRQLFRFVKRFYSMCSIDSVTDLTVIQEDRDLSEIGLDKNQAEQYTIGRIGNNVSFPLIIQLMSNGTIYVWKSNCPTIEPDTIPDSIIYKFTGLEEYIMTGGELVIAPASGYPAKSIFASPTYSALDDALNAYYDDFAKYSVCSILKDAWLDEKRLRLKPAPESKFRDSLWQHLKSSLRTSSEILREQNVSTENPIDIKISWQETTERALIEIKWLGVSYDIENDKKTANHSMRRLKLGSKQLIDYVEVAAEQTPFAYFKGYLVVFDARRQMIDTDEKLAKHTAEHSIYFREREDGDQLVRRFTEGNCTYKRFFLEPQLEERSFSS